MPLVILRMEDEDEETRDEPMQLIAHACVMPMGKTTRMLHALDGLMLSFGALMDAWPECSGSMDWMQRANERDREIDVRDCTALQDAECAREHDQY